MRDALYFYSGIFMAMLSDSKTYVSLHYKVRNIFKLIGKKYIFFKLNSG